MNSLRMQPARRSRFLCLATLVLVFFPPLLGADSYLPRLKITVPAERSGGWDLTARAMAETLQKEGLVGDVEIDYSPGAGGLIGLAQFVTSRQGATDALFIGGMFTVGSVIQNHSNVSLLDTTPLARLTIDNAAIAVPANSRFKSAEDLIEAVHAAPGAIAWVGGSRAGVDEMNLHEFGRALGIAPSRLHYTGLPGGGEVGRALVAERYQAGISGLSEFESLVDTRQLRILAVLTNDSIHDIDAPEFSELGIHIERLNWRGVFAPPGIDEVQVAVLAILIDEMVRSETWQRLLDQHHWLDAYLAGDEFREFVKSEQQLVANELALMTEMDPSGESVIGSVLLRRYAWAAGLALFSVLLLAALLLQRHRARQREEGLQQAYEAATGEVMLHTEQLERALTNIHTHIEQEFDKWNLTIAEKEIALLLLKGLRLKDIADARGTSERTVRQQAQAVYKKAGLEGRFELAAYFIEDVIHSMELESRGVEPV